MPSVISNLKIKVSAIHIFFVVDTDHYSKPVSFMNAVQDSVLVLCSLISFKMVQMIAEYLFTWGFYRTLQMSIYPFASLEKTEMCTFSCNGTCPSIS